MCTHGSSILLYPLPFTGKNMDEMWTCSSLSRCWNKLWFTNKTLCLIWEMVGSSPLQTPLSQSVCREEAGARWFGRKHFFEPLPNLSFSDFPLSYSNFLGFTVLGPWTKCFQFDNINDPQLIVFSSSSVGYCFWNNRNCQYQGYLPAFCSPSSLPSVLSLPFLFSAGSPSPAPADWYTNHRSR